MTRKRKWLLAIVIPFVAGWILLIGSASIPNKWWADRAHAAAVKRFSHARSLADLRSAVGDHGCVYVYPDKTWIAIWCDSWSREHARNPDENQTRAVALDSEGEWFESNRGASVGFDQRPTIPDYEKEFAWALYHSDTGYLRSIQEWHLIYTLTTAKSLDAVRAELLATDFSPFNPDVAKPKVDIAVTDADVTVPKEPAK